MRYSEKQLHARTKFGKDYKDLADHERLEIVDTEHFDRRPNAPHYVPTNDGW